MITIRVPDNFAPERQYIIDMIFSEFLGLQYRIERLATAQHYEIHLGNKKTIFIKDHFFLKFKDGLNYLNSNEIPSKIGFGWNQFCPKAAIPVIYGNDEMTVDKDSIVCGIDIFASSFFMLSRWEEYANKNRDSHGRFPSSESLAYRNGLLERAVVNEYVEMLWNMMSYLKCKQKRKRREFKTLATHDVDEPFCYATTPLKTALKRMGNALIRERQPALAFKNLHAWFEVKKGSLELDPYNTFDLIMDISDSFSLKSQFNFMAGRRLPSCNEPYDLYNKTLRSLMKNIYERGHEIGLHASYGSFDNPQKTKDESDMLKSVCEEEGILQHQWCSRQHFLRWETPTTSNNLELANLDYDSTLSYADAAGFRCGVCYEFPVFNILARRPLRLRERPLLVMECSVIDSRYMNLGSGEKAFAVIKSIKDTCRSFNGDFVVLWHNTRFIDRAEQELYHQTLLA